MYNSVTQILKSDLENQLNKKASQTQGKT